MNRRDRKKEITKNSLLDAALGLFASRGIYTTRVEDITEAADVAKGAFYTYFDSKLDMVAELLVQAVQCLEEQYLRPDGPGTAGVERLRRLTEDHGRFWRDHPEYTLLFHQSRGMLLLEPEGSPNLNRAFRLYLECIARKLSGHHDPQEAPPERIIHAAAGFAGLTAGYYSFATAAGLAGQPALTADMTVRGLGSFIQDSGHPELAPGPADSLKT